jgi:hypothetical protein
VRCAGYGTEASLNSHLCYTLNGSSWAADQTGFLSSRHYKTLEECEAARVIAGPSNYACVSGDSPTSCLPTDDLCEALCL